MLKYLFALILLAVLTSDASACDRGARRGGALSRIFALERAVLRVPARVATLPLRVVETSSATRSATTRTTTSSVRTTTYRSATAAPPVTTRYLFVPIPVR